MRIASELNDYRRLERVCRDWAESATMPEERRVMLTMAERYAAAARVVSRPSRHHSILSRLVIAVHGRDAPWG